MSKAVSNASVSGEALINSVPTRPSHCARINPKSLFAFWQIFVLVTGLTSLFTVTNATAQQPDRRNQKPESFERPFLIEFQGPIDQKLSRYLHSKIEFAKTANADLIIIEIDSPGGLKSESLRIADTLKKIDWAYTVAFIPEQAISGGALVSLGCDEIVVGDESRFGDIGEIYFDPEAWAFRYAPEKLNSPLVAQAKAIAKAKGYPPEIAEAMIDKEAQVFRRKLGNIWEYKTVRVGQPDPADWELIEESGEGRFLTLGGPRMLELGLATSNSNTREEFAEQFKIAPESLTVLKYTTTDLVADTLCLPWVSGLLIVIGLLALYLELCAPGLGVGGVIALLCGALFFWSRFFAGTADTLELILFLGGVAFLLLELFVIPGWGISGFLALLLMTTSVILAGQDFVVPSNDREWAKFMSQTLMIMFSGLGVMVGAFFITRSLGTLPIFNRLILTPEIDGSANASASKDPDGKPIPTEHPIVSVGDWGESESLLRPAGRALFAGRSIDVVSDGAFIEPNHPIKVIEIRGNRVVVVAVES